MKLQPSAISEETLHAGTDRHSQPGSDFETAENIAIDYDIICEKEVTGRCDRRTAERGR